MGVAGDGSCSAREIGSLGGGGAVSGSVVSGESWADSCIYSTVVCDITDGDRVLASSMSSTYKSKTKKAVSNLHKISDGQNCGCGKMFTYNSPLFAVKCKILPSILQRSSL